MDSDFPLREADVSMVRVNLSDSAQVQDLIVKIVDCLEIFPPFWRGFAYTVKQEPDIIRSCRTHQGDGTWDAQVVKVNFFWYREVPSAESTIAQKWQCQCW